MPERHISSLGAMGWGRDTAKKFFRRHRRRRRRRRRQLECALLECALLECALLECALGLGGGGHKNAMYLRHSMPYDNSKLQRQ